MEKSWGIHFIETSPYGMSNTCYTLSLPNKLRSLPVMPNIALENTAEFKSGIFSEDGGNSYTAIFLSNGYTTIFIPELNDWVAFCLKVDIQNYPWTHTPKILCLEGLYRLTPKQKKIIFS